MSSVHHFGGLEVVPFVVSQRDFMAILSLLRTADPNLYPGALLLSARLQASYAVRERARLQDGCPASPRALLVLRALNPHTASVIDLTATAPES